MDIFSLCGDFSTFKCPWQITGRLRAFPAIPVRCCLPGAQGLLTAPAQAETSVNRCSHWRASLCSLLAWALPCHAVMPLLIGPQRNIWAHSMKTASFYFNIVCLGNARWIPKVLLFPCLLARPPPQRSLGRAPPLSNSLHPVHITRGAALEHVPGISS